MSEGVNKFFVVQEAIKYFSWFGVWVGFVAGAVLEVVERAVKVSQYDSMVSLSLVAVVVNIVVTA